MTMLFYKFLNILSFKTLYYFMFKTEKQLSQPGGEQYLKFVKRNNQKIQKEKKGEKLVLIAEVDYRKFWGKSQMCKEREENYEK